MKREDVKNKIPGITEEQLNWIMQENGADINREKSAAEQYKTQLANANAQLKTAQDGLAAFDGKKKPEEYEAELAKLKADMKAQAEAAAAAAQEETKKQAEQMAQLPDRVAALETANNDIILMMADLIGGTTE